jgi:hypothetical protein
MRLSTANHSPLPEVEHIGAPSHLRRNLWLVLLCAGAAAVIGAYDSFVGRTDGVEMQRLEQFRGAMAERCEAPGFDRAPLPIERDMYLHNASIRAAVDHQYAALGAGADCEQVIAALRAADYPIPEKPEGVTPTIRLQPSGQ